MENQNNPVQSQPYQNPAAYTDASPLSLGNYLIMMIVSAIPVVGFIMMLIWAFSGNTNLNRKNYARAALIMMLIGVVLCAVFASAIIAAFASMGGGYMSSY